MNVSYFYFGRPDCQLFGAHHSPLSPPPQDGVVLCHAWGPEYLRSHRALNRLAHKLSEAGFSTLRFDFAGSGDSQPLPNSGEREQWQDNIAAAIEELRARSAVHRICLIGLRLGATLAAVSASELACVDKLVLWDPTTNGRNYLKELRARHQSWLKGSFAVPARRSGNRPSEEVLGFPLEDSLIASLNQLDLLRLEKSPAERVLLIETQTPSSSDAARRHMERLGAKVEHHVVEARPVWLKQQSEFESISVPVHVLASIVHWLTSCEN